MPKKTYGPQVKKRVKRLLEALLCLVDGEFEDGSFDIKHNIKHNNWVEEDSLNPKLIVQTTLVTLELLTQKDKYDGKLTKSQIREALKLLDKDNKDSLLKILEDNRATKKGSDNWHFTLKLWSKDKEQNLKRFDEVWESNRPLKSKALETNYQKEDNTKVSGDEISINGDFIYQLFRQASTSLSEKIKVQYFENLVEEKTKNFVGREFIFQSINNLLADADFSSGYIVISGEPGIGKSSLMAKFVKSRGAVHHFNNVLMGIRSPKDFLENICAQLIVRYELKHSTLPPEAGKNSGFLSQLLGEIANQGQQQPVVILVDALDEADDTGLSPGANRLFLPPNLPEGIFFIVTSREEYDYRLHVTHRKDIYLRDNDPRNLEDVRQYIRNYVQEHRIKMSPQIEKWGVSEDEFVDVITDKSEGNFMYLFYVLCDIREGKLTQSNVDNIHNLPKGLHSYYQRHWREMEAQNPEEFERYYEPVACQLAVAREPVSVNQLHEWTQLPPKLITKVIHDWLEFFNEFAPKTGEHLYHIYHASFQTFLREDVGLKPYEQKVVQTAFNKIQW